MPDRRRRIRQGNPPGKCYCSHRSRIHRCRNNFRSPANSCCRTHCRCTHCLRKAGIPGSKRCSRMDNRVHKHHSHTHRSCHSFCHAVHNVQHSSAHRIRRCRTRWPDSCRRTDHRSDQDHIPATRIGAGKAHILHHLQGSPMDSPGPLRWDCYSCRKTRGSLGGS